MGVQSATKLDIIGRYMDVDKPRTTRNAMTVGGHFIVDYDIRTSRATIALTRSTRATASFYALVTASVNRRGRQSPRTPADHLTGHSLVMASYDE